MIFTTPFGKKEGCGYDKTEVITGGATDLSTKSLPQSVLCSISLNSREARWINILNNPSRFYSVKRFLRNHHSPAFDTSLDSNSTKLLTEDQKCQH